MAKIITRNFYEINTVKAARNLLGMILCRKMSDGTILKGKIVETEAYTQDEPSCHAYIGVTKRNEVMFKKAGLAYVYFTYGMYHCLNIITEKEGYGAGVLIRALEPLSNFSNTNGPAKLCRELNITKELNGVDICSNKSPLYLEYGDYIKDSYIIRTERIGIKRACELKWRFYIKDNKFVSKTS